MDNGKLERIARKVVKAEEIYECSYEKAGGSSKTVWIVQDGQFTEPVRMIIKKLGDDSFDVMCFKKSFYAKKSKNDKKQWFKDRVVDAFCNYDTDNEINSHLYGITVSDLLKWRKTMDTDSLVRELLDNYEMTMQDIEEQKGRLFDEDKLGSSRLSFEYDGMKIIFAREEDKPYIVNLLNDAKTLLGGIAGELLYGTMEFGYSKKNGGLYNSHTDYVFVLEGANHFEHEYAMQYLLHELGHRFWTKRGFSEVVQVGLWERQEQFGTDGKNFNGLYERAKNGEIEFPTNYSKKSVNEFFAECFALYFLGKLNGVLKDEFKRLAKL